MSIKYFSKFSPFMVNTLPKSNPLACKSQRLMLDYGYIQACGATGFYNILPLGQRVLDKLCNMIETTMEERVGALKISLSCMTSTDIWKQSGRLEAAWGDIFALKDRNDKQLCLNPTHEEAICSMVTQVMGANPSFNSPKQLPLCMYQIGRKYRDEGKPKLGLLRAREFLMADAYGFHADQAGAQITYDLVRRAYFELFGSILDHVILAAPARSNPLDSQNIAPTLMGEGSYGTSHEYHVASPVGEDRLARCPNCGLNFGLNPEDVEHENTPIETPGSTPQVGWMVGGHRKAAYHHSSSSTAESSKSTHDTMTCPSCKFTGNGVMVAKPGEIRPAKDFQIFNSIEVAHTFHLGTHFSRAFGITVVTTDSSTRSLEPCHVTCYGIGVTRLMAAILETSPEDRRALSATTSPEFNEIECVTWPPALVPFKVAIVPPKAGSKEEKAWSQATKFYMQNLGGFIGPSLLTAFPYELKGEILCDDRTHLTVGRRVQDMKRIGVPLIIICGRKLLDDPPQFEFYNGHNNTTTFLQESDLINTLGKCLRELFSPI